MTSRRIPGAAPGFLSFFSSPKSLQNFSPK
nr:MAG TPA_asm: hypothetical protein [Caudoviricetes sp.]